MCLIFLTLTSIKLKLIIALYIYLFIYQFYFFFIYTYIFCSFSYIHLTADHSHLPPPYQPCLPFPQIPLSCSYLFILLCDLPRLTKVICVTLGLELPVGA